MEAIVKFDKDADIPFFKKLFENLKCVSSFEFVETAEEEMPNEEYDEKFIELLEKSSRQIGEGKFIEMTPEKFDEFFSKYKKNHSK